MVRRTRKRSKNKKGGADTSFTGKFLQGANDIGDGLKAASKKAKETYTGAQQGIKDFNAAAEAEGRRLAQGGLFEKNPQALLKPRRPVFPKPVTPTIIGRGGKRKTRRKKRRKNKKRKTKKRRRKRKTKKKRRR